MLLRRAALLALLPLSLAACGSKLSDLRLPGLNRNPPPAATVAQPRGEAVSPLEVPIEVGGTATPLGTANAAVAGVENFTVQGPSFLAAVRGGTASVRRAGGKDVGVSVRRVDFGGGVEFVGGYADRTFSLNLRAAECRDGTGTWPMTATMKLAGSTATGCASATGQEPRGFAAKLPTAKPAAAKPAVKKAAPKKAAPKPATTTPAETPATTPSTAPATTPAETPATTPATEPTTPATPAEPAATPVPTPAPTPAPAATPAATEAAPAATPSTSTTAVPLIVPPAN